MASEKLLTELEQRRAKALAMGGPEKTRGLECLDLEIFAAGRSLADVDECRNIRMARPERARNHRTQMRAATVCGGT